jgi:hypothetical protein
MSTFALLLGVHICVALASLVVSTMLLFSPSRDGLRINAGLIIITLISGTYLVTVKPAHLLETCGLGLLYLGFVGVGTLAAHRKLARANVATNL